MTELFADLTKFRKLDKNNTLTQLTTLQTYLRTLHNQGETNDDVYNTIPLDQHVHTAFLKPTQPLRIHRLLDPS